jgi:hypothetical protein
MEGMEPPSGMIMRWLDTLSNFNSSIKHRPGKKHANADALSRCALAEEPDSDDEPDEMIAMMHEMINVCPIGTPPHPLSTALPTEKTNALVTYNASVLINWTSSGYSLVLRKFARHVVAIVLAQFPKTRISVKLPVQ